MPTPSFISALKSDRCVHYLNNTLVNRAQSVDLVANVPTSVIDELGNAGHTGIVTDPAEISFHVSALDTGLDLTKAITGKTAATTFNLPDFIGAAVDYIGVVRDNTGNFFRSVYIRGAGVDSISFSYDAGGSAAETYNLVADNLTVFDGYVLTKTYTITATDVANGYFTLPTQGSEAPLQTKTNSYFNGGYLLRATRTRSGIAVNMMEGNDYSYASATKRVTASGLTAGDVWTLVFYSATIGTALNPVFSTTAPAAVRGGYTPLSIGVSTKTWIPRLQSAGIGVAFKRERIKQIGSTQVLYTPGSAPSIAGNFSVLMNDFALKKLLTYGSDTANETQFGVEQLPAYGTQNNLGLEVVIKSPVDNSVLKRVTIPDIVTGASGMPATVNGTLTESYNWTGKSGTLTISNS